MIDVLNLKNLSFSSSLTFNVCLSKPFHPIFSVKNTKDNKLMDSNFEIYISKRSSIDFK